MKVILVGIESMVPFFTDLRWFPIKKNETLKKWGILFGKKCRK